MTTEFKTKKYVCFDPSSSEVNEFWESDKLYDFKWIIQDLSVPDEEPIRRTGYGRFSLSFYEIYDLRKHPNLKQEVLEWKKELGWK